MKTKKVDLSFIDKIEDLKAIPSIVIELMSLLSGTPDKKKEKEIVEKIKLDPSMTSFVLKLCNSALFGIKRNIKSIRHGLNMIGFPRYKSILISFFLRNLYDKSDGKYIVDYLWRHSLYVAFICRELAHHLGFNEDRSEESYIAALMHDIGKLVIYFHDPKSYGNIMQKVDRERQSFLPLEEKIYGYSHIDTGYYLTDRWGLPDLFKDSIRFHHCFNEYKGKEETVRLVTFANTTAHFAIKKQEEMLPEGFLEFYELSREKYENIIDKISTELANARLLSLSKK